VIGAAALLTGLLLLVAGVAPAWIPDGATFARSGIRRSPVLAFVVAPIHPTTWYANGTVVLGLFTGVVGGAIVFSIASAGLSVLLAGIGILFIALAIEASRLLARIERWRAFAGEPSRPAAYPYRPLRGSLLEIARAEFADESRWRDVLYVAVNVPLAALEFVAVFVAWAVALWLVTSPIWYDLSSSASSAFFGLLDGKGGVDLVIRVALGLVLLAAAASLSQVVVGLHRGLVSTLICTSESRELRRQVAELRESRSAVIASEASELHRIERDLHDGAQQRLVALTIDLGRASERVESDPAGAKELILQGQEQARAALAEIRALVRGIAPSILLDRGLAAAVASLVSARGPVPTSLASDLAPGLRLPDSVKRTAYFVASEALANVSKHSGASRAEVRLRLEGPTLVVEIQDDGRGGASVQAGGGLAGLEGRVQGVDGRLTVTSPIGGPTVVRAEIPVGPIVEAPAAPVPSAGQESR
jgi:signal transduction histidine kinase